MGREESEENESGGADELILYKSRFELHDDWKYIPRARRKSGVLEVHCESRRCAGGGHVTAT